MAASRKQTIQQHGWLDLIDVDGPFLSRPALQEQLDEAWPPKLERELRARLADIPASTGTAFDEPSIAVDRFLHEVLGYSSEQWASANGTTAKRVTLTHVDTEVSNPNYRDDSFRVHALVHPVKRPTDPVADTRMVVITADQVADAPPSFDPTVKTRRDDRLAKAGWRATPVQRGALAARQVGADMALVTDGHRHLVVWVGSGVTGYGWITPDRYRLDRRLPDAVVALLKADRVCSSTDTTTADLLRISQDKQAELTGALGLQVRRAAESIVNAVSRANRSDSRLLDGLEPHEVYRGVVTVLMRTVFLLTAEENDLIGGEGLYDESYAVSTLLDELDDDFHRHQSILRQRHGAWLRLLAAARAVHQGVEHDRMSVYGYGGGLFDPARYPFLEGITTDGEPLEVGVVDDATVRHALDLLQRLNGQRLSYRAFSVEQIGQVYEHLLDHSAKKVPDDHVILGLRGAKGAEPEIPLSALQTRPEPKKLAKWLADNHDPRSGRSLAAWWLERIEGDPKPEVLATLGKACQSDPVLIDEISPYLGLLDADARGEAKVYLPGDVYVTETSVRRDSGTSYTSPAFAAEIAKHALRHLVYSIELESDDDPDTGLKHPEEILDLKVCDPAVGSGAIIVAGVRYLADRLVQARVEHGELEAERASTAATVATSADPYVQARRDVVARCIYAVDRDPMAVEMTKLSLWLVSMAKNRPFTFIDHAIRSGDSLLGITSLAQLRGFHLDHHELVTDARESGSPLLFDAYHGLIDRKITQAMEFRSQVRAGDVAHPDEATRRSSITARADRELADLRLIADAITATCYSHAASREQITSDALRGNVLHLALDIGASREALSAVSRHRPVDATGRFKFFHWALEFPEVLTRGGFDAVIGNPPYQGGTMISSASGTSYYQALQKFVADGSSTDRADLAVFFLRRASTISANLGLIVTNSLREGDSQHYGYRFLVSKGWSIYRADSSIRWPGRDAVYVSRVWMSRRPLPRPVLDSVPVKRISSALNTRASVDTLPKPLQQPIYAENGVQPGGRGLIVPKGHMAEQSAFARILINGVRAHAVAPDEEWILDFTGLSETEVLALGLESEIVEEQERLVRATTYKSWHKRWWEFRSPRKVLRAKVDGLSADQVVAIVRVSKHCVPVFVSVDAAWTDSLVVFATDDPGLFGMLHSEAHWWWVYERSSKMKSDLRYSTSDVYDTWPLTVTDELVKIGQVLSAERDRLVKTEGGVTPALNRIHDPDCESDVVMAVRRSLQDLNREVCGMLRVEVPSQPLDHREVAGRGMRFTLSPAAVDDVLDALLLANEAASVMQARARGDLEVPASG